MRHLIHIGLAKSGSNTLRRWFAQHPQLVFMDGAIAGFPNVYEIGRQAYTPPPGGRWRVTSSEVLATPNPFTDIFEARYERVTLAALKAAQEEASELLASLFPTATVLVVTRAPKSWVLSAYSQYVRTGGVDDFTTFIEGPGAWSVLAYDEILGHYRKRFGEGHLIVMPYELLLDDAPAFLRALEDRLGLDAAQVEVGSTNPSLSPEALYWSPRLSRLMTRLPRPFRRIYLRLIFANRLQPVFALLRRLRPKGRATPDMITDAHLEAFRGQAQTLRDNPLYRPYLDDYLI